MRIIRVPALLIAPLFALALAACGGGGTTATPTATAPASATPIVQGTPAPAAGAPTELVLMTHDSFDAKEEVLAEFERAYNAKITIVKAGDANQLVNRAVLSAGNPEADVLFGVDNLTFARVRDAGVFAEYVSSRRAAIPQDIRDQFGDSALVTPIDYGFVALNFDAAQGTPPSTLEELTTPAWRGKLVVEDPATSSPGLQFLATTVAHFGDGGWQQFWRDLRANDVLIVDGWETAYYTSFSVYGGDRPLVVSYTTSPAAEVFFGELAEPPTVNVIPGGTLFRQVEAAGVLAGSKHPELAQLLIDFLVGEQFQGQIPETMFVYPVIAGLPLPEWWKWADVDVTPATLAVDAAEIDRWIAEWTEIMRR
ncbi:MAG: thiamine ABC transporter substrate-binding protein [Chloroflexi bacterium]|nr:thiamine ABC transporter substrate-binding protein [Chloroflexota bacterium]